MVIILNMGKSGKKKAYMQVFLTLCVILAAVFAYLRYVEKRTLFYPTRDREFFPKEANLAFEDVSFRAQDGVKLNGWFIPREGARYTVLFCHGNAGNISHRVSKLSFFHGLGCNVFIFDYRGYGVSEGRPSEQGLYSDAIAAYGYLRSRGIPPQEMIGYGESLGGAVIVDVASKNALRALILDSTFSSVQDMTRYVYPFIPYWVFASRFNTADKVKSITVPKLIIHSLNDEIVPYALSRRLFDMAAPPKLFLKVHGGHNSCFYESKGLYEKNIADFLENLSK